MSEFEREPQIIKVNDRRRFDPEGNPVAAPETNPVQATPPQLEAGPDADATENFVEKTLEVDPRLTELQGEVERLQAELSSSRTRVDELARAYQALDRDREEFKARLNRERERMISVEKG